jgi:hypothetical protein
MMPFESRRAGKRLSRGQTRIVVDGVSIPGDVGAGPVIDAGNLRRNITPTWRLLIKPPRPHSYVKLSAEERPFRAGSEELPPREIFQRDAEATICQLRAHDPRHLLRDIAVQRCQQRHRKRLTVSNSLNPMSLPYAIAVLVPPANLIQKDATGRGIVVPVGQISLGVKGVSRRKIAVGHDAAAVGDLVHKRLTVGAQSDGLTDLHLAEKSRVPVLRNRGEIEDQVFPPLAGRRRHLKQPPILGSHQERHEGDEIGLVGADVAFSREESGDHVRCARRKVELDLIHER